MVIYNIKNIEEIIKNNLKQIKNDNETIIGVGTDVIVKFPNQERVFFYKGSVKYLSKDDLHKFVGSWHKEEEYIDRYITAVRAEANKLTEKLQEKIQNNKIIDVLENDLYTKKLINSDLIQEVQTFVFKD